MLFLTRESSIHILKPSSAYFFYYVNKLIDWKSGKWHHRFKKFILKGPGRGVYLQVNALSEWIIGIYLHSFTSNEWEISIPHSAASSGIANFEFIVSESVRANPDNSRVSALTFLLFKLNTLQSKIVKLWVSRSHGVMTVVCWILHHDNDFKEVVSSQPRTCGTIQPIRTSEFVQCMKVE